MDTLIRNLRIVDGGLIREGSVLIRDGKIHSILPADVRRDGTETFDGNGAYASAGFIDLHTHGAGGSDFMDGTPEAFLTACRTHLAHGTTTIFPTTLAASKEEILRSIRAFRAVKPVLEEMQTVPGLHLEGPYFDMDQKGGQDPEYIRNPDPAEYLEILEAADGAVRRWSIAPELPGAMELADELSRRGILPSIAHTAATYADCEEAIRHGYSLITHLYSCTSTITRRSGFRILGVTEAAYCFDALDVEIIADGCHLPPELIRMIIRCKGTGRICLISDSLRCAGQDVKETISGSLGAGRTVIIEDGVAKMPDRTAFAGSIATDDRLVRTVWKKAGIPLPQVIRMMCENPARVMRLGACKGRLLPGYDADLVLFDEDVRVLEVFHRGTRISL